MIILGIDPGTNQSAVVFYDSSGKVETASWRPNGALLEGLRLRNGRLLGEVPEGVTVCEMVQHYGSGMPAGKEVFETVRWIGRFQEAVEARGGRFEILYRPQIKAQICGSAKAKDANVRQALIDRFGGDSAALGGKKCPKCKGSGVQRERLPCVPCDGSGWLRKPGPLAGISSHMWSALAAAVAWAELHPEDRP